MCYHVRQMPDPPAATARVGVRELRQNLSVYLRRIDRGERFEVTDRGNSRRPADPASRITVASRAAGGGRAARSGPRATRWTCRRRPAIPRQPLVRRFSGTGTTVSERFHRRASWSIWTLRPSSSWWFPSRNRRCFGANLARDAEWVSSALARVELLRALRRTGAAPNSFRFAEELLDRMALVAVDQPVLNAAASAEPDRPPESRRAAPGHGAFAGGCGRLLRLRRAAQRCGSRRRSPRALSPVAGSVSPAAGGSPPRRRWRR